MNSRREGGGSRLYADIRLAASPCELWSRRPQYDRRHDEDAAGGAAIWSLAEGSLSHLSVSVFVAAVAVAAVATVTDKSAAAPD